ncbi:MAG: hypothetical protein ACREGJ_01765 [Candidatus Saccharimonadales bacterium]
MSNIMHFVTHPLSLLTDIATKGVIKQFAKKYHFVYFGYVSHQDEHDLVRGITVSTTHLDNHYTVGTFHGHDIALVDRRNKLTFPNKPSSEYKWLIMQFDLQQDKLPHIFMDANHHDETFYANMFVKFANFENAAGIFESHGSLFLRHFKVFAPPDTFDEVREVLTAEITAMLAHHFRQFDYEISDDKLYIYASNKTITLATLNDMLRVGLWLANHLNSVTKP